MKEIEFETKGEYFGQKCLFFPHPLSKNKLISSLFSGNRNIQNYEIWSHLARSAEIFEYLVLRLAETVINGKKTGKNRPNRLKTGKILGVRFSFLALFLHSFSESLFLPHPWGGAIGQNVYPCKDYRRISKNIEDC